MSAATSRIDEVLERAVTSRDVPNVVAVAAGPDGVTYEGAAGPSAPGRADTVGPGSRFAIMSMTKPVVTVAALVLAEQLKLDLDAPVEEYCPAFDDLQVLTDVRDGRPVTRPAAARATVRQLLTHTSGLGYWFWNDRVAAWARATGAPAVITGERRVLESPLTCDPGSAFVYGLSTDWLGQVIEAVWGQGLDDAVEALVTGPLGMADTVFDLPAAARAAVVPVHLRAGDGSWAASRIEMPAAPEYRSGGHGLYSTPRDYLVFQRMLLGDGVAGDGTRILRAETVREAFSDQIAPLTFPAQIASADPASSLGLNVGPGYTWGHGLLLNTADEPDRRRAGSGGWAGMFNTYFWVDRAAGVTGAIYSSLLPFLEPGALRTYQDFEASVYASL